MPLKIEHHIVLDSSPAFEKLVELFKCKSNETKTLVELTNKLKAARQKLVASFGENVPPS